MKTVADVLGVSRCNLAERLKGKAKPRGPYLKADVKNDALDCIAFELHICLTSTLEGSLLRSAAGSEGRKEMAATKMLHVRVDDDLIEDANAIFRSLGLSMSEAVRLFLHRSVVSKGIPLELNVPNASTLEALAEAREIRHAKRSRFSTPDELFANLNEGKD
jgi:DNA-damage-inducible protein J